MLEQLKTVAVDLTTLETPWALIGALAVSVHTEPRTTRDIDVAVAVDSYEELVRIERKLLSRGYSDSQLLMHAMPTRKMGLRLRTPTTCSRPLALDLLYASSGIEHEIVASAQLLEILPGVQIPVASRPHLIAMKVRSVDDAERIRDQADLRQLLFGATKQEIDLARAALALINERGFADGKNLSQELSRWIDKFVPA